jgi:DNA-binding transcriptional LysR family regulator
VRGRLDLNEIDLNLLPKFRALYRRRNVSEAARELHLTQSALSNALARMRAMFGDELFVRTPAEMQPTAFAHAIAPPVEHALVKLEGELTRVNGFEPLRSSRIFKIAMTQLGEAWLAPQIVAAARTTAPDIVVSTVVDCGGLEMALGRGSIDFAVGHLPDLDNAFRHTELAIHEIVCLVRAGHPVLAEPLTVPTLLSCTFAEVVEHGTMYGALSRAIGQLAPRGAKRYRTANVMALPYIIAATDLVAIVPAWFAARCAPSLGLRLIRFSEQQTVARIRLFWHPNFEQDPGHLWMRSIIARAAVTAQIEEAIQAGAIVNIATFEPAEFVSF